MALDFKNVINWVISEGTVTKVVDSLDRVIWQKDTTPEPIVDPISGTMSFGSNTTIDANTGVITFDATPILSNSGVLVF